MKSDKNKIVQSGKRKTAVARAVIVEGTGVVRLNKRDYKTLQFFDRLRIEEPIRIAKEILGSIHFDVLITMNGGGQKGQIEAARIALSRAMLDFTKSKELKEAFLAYDRGLLVADVRRKEAYKPGDSKARSRRQKSYR